MVSDSLPPHRWKPTTLPCPWDSPGKNTGVCCHFLLQCMKVKSEREVAQSCPTLSDPMDCSLPGSSVHGIFQARVLELGCHCLGLDPLYSTLPSLKRLLSQLQSVPSYFLLEPFGNKGGSLVPQETEKPLILVNKSLPIKGVRQAVTNRKESKNSWPLMLHKRVSKKLCPCIFPTTPLRIPYDC